MKNKFKKILAMLMAVTMVAGIIVPGMSAKAGDNDIIVLYTNDVHCSIDDYAVLAAYRAQLISEGYEVVTVDAGDAIQGEAIGTLTEGSAIEDLMSTAGYDFAVPGNHELIMEWIHFCPWLRKRIMNICPAILWT